MNADAWQAYTQPLQLLGLLGPKADPRKLRLFLVACARRVLPPEPDDELLNALVVAERFAEGLASRAELGRASLALKKHHAARAARWPTLYSEHIRSLPAWHATREAISSAATEGVTVCAWSSTRTPSGSMTLPTREWRAQCELLREVFGNPFHPIALRALRLPSAVGLLAQATLEARKAPGFTLDGAQLAVLADALEEAGAVEGLTAHLRAPGPHVLGCFVLDALRPQRTPLTSGPKGAH